MKDAIKLVNERLGEDVASNKAKNFEVIIRFYYDKSWGLKTKEEAEEKVFDELNGMNLSDLALETQEIEESIDTKIGEKSDNVNKKKHVDVYTHSPNDIADEFERGNYEIVRTWLDGNMARYHAVLVHLEYKPDMARKFADKKDFLMSGNVKKESKENKKTNPSMKPKKDIKTAEEAKQFAIDWQSWASDRALSYRELSDWQVYFEDLADKFGLVGEFKENGII